LERRRKEVEVRVAAHDVEGPVVQPRHEGAEFLLGVRLSALQYRRSSGGLAEKARASRGPVEARGGALDVVCRREAGKECAVDSVRVVRQVTGDSVVELIGAAISSAFRHW